jgi:hypothetical protein
VAELDSSDRLVLGAAEGTVLRGVLEGASDPTTSDIPAGHWLAWRNTTTGKLLLAINDSGTIRKVAFE